MADLRHRRKLGAVHVQKPRAAKKLYFDSIPKTVDEYIGLLEAYHAKETGPRSASKVRSGTSTAARRRTSVSGQLRAAAQSGQRLERA